MNKRRELIVALGANALAAQLPALAQQPSKVWRVGVLSQNSRPVNLDSHFLGALVRGMREFGYIEGKSLVIEWRFSNGKSEPLAGFAAEFVNSKVDVIVAGGTQSTAAAQKATTTIPVVMVGISDPVGSGFIKSLSRPGGNITGVSNLIGDMGSKYLEMLLAFDPKLSRVAVLVHPDNSGHASIMKGVEAAAQKRGLKVLRLPARTVPDIANAFSIMAQNSSQALIVANDSFFREQLQYIADRAIKNRLLSIAARFDYADVGFLMSYGSNSFEEYRHAATYVDKILKGAKPADLPVEQPTKFELVVNQKTARALGIKIPQSILVQATKVIE